MGLPSARALPPFRPLASSLLCSPAHCRPVVGLLPFGTYPWDLSVPGSDSHSTLVFSFPSPPPRAFLILFTHSFPLVRTPEHPRSRPLAPSLRSTFPVVLPVPPTPPKDPRRPPKPDGHASHSPSPTCLLFAPACKAGGSGPRPTPLRFAPVPLSPPFHFYPCHNSLQPNRSRFPYLRSLLNRPLLSRFLFSVHRSFSASRSRSLRRLAPLITPPSPPRPL